MCGRFTRHYTWEDLFRLYHLTSTPANIQPSYNVCPTDTVDTVRTTDGKRELVPMRWGLIPWHWKKPLKEMKLATFNARVETVATKPMFRDAFKRRRCLIPASGYYEWADTPDGKQPHYFTARDGSPVLTMAGLWTCSTVTFCCPLPRCRLRASSRVAYVRDSLFACERASFRPSNVCSRSIARRKHSMEAW